MRAASSGHSSDTEINKKPSSQRNVHDMKTTLYPAEPVDDKMVLIDGDINRKRTKRGGERSKLNRSGKVIGRGRPGCQPAKSSTSQDRVNVPETNSYVRGINRSNDSDLEEQQKSKAAACSPNDKLKTNLYAERQSLKYEGSSTDDSFVYRTPDVKGGVDESKIPKKILGFGRGLASTNSSPEVGKSEGNLSISKKSSVKPTNIFNPAHSSESDFEVQQKSKAAACSPNDKLKTNIYAERRLLQKEDSSTDDNFVCSPSAVKGAVDKSKMPKNFLGRGIGRGLASTNSSPEVGKSEGNLSISKKSSVKPTNIFSPAHSSDSDFELQQKSKAAACSPNDKLKTNLYAEKQSLKNEGSSTDDNFVCSPPAVKGGVDESKMPKNFLARGIGRGLASTNASPEVGKSERNLAVSKKSSVKPTYIFSPAHSSESDFEVQQKSKAAECSPNDKLKTNLNAERRLLQKEDSSTDDNFVCSPSAVKGAVDESKMAKKFLGRGIGRGLASTNASPEVGKSERNLAVSKKSSVKPTNTFNRAESAGLNACGHDKIIVSPKVNPGIVKKKSEKTLGRGHAISGDMRPGIKQIKSPKETDASTVQKLFDTVKSLHENELPQMPDVIPRDQPESGCREDEQSSSK